VSSKKSQANFPKYTLVKLSPIIKLLRKNIVKILYSGGLQIRSENADKPLLNVRTFQQGELALSSLYPLVRPGDYPVAQDCFGDQFLIRDNSVIKLMAETGDIEEFNCTWEQFLAWADEDPYDRLDLPENLNLEIGKLLFAYPPFCTKEGANATIKPIDGEELIRFHAEFARQINGGS
jgi:hypothetical protein